MKQTGKIRFRLARIFRPDQAHQCILPSVRDVGVLYLRVGLAVPLLDLHADLDLCHRVFGADEPVAEGYVGLCPVCLGAADYACVGAVGVVHVPFNLLVVTVHVPVLSLVPAGVLVVGAFLKNRNLSHRDVYSQRLRQCIRASGPGPTRNLLVRGPIRQSGIDCASFLYNVPQGDA